MKLYPKYKDSGIEWIGDIPIDWTTIQIKRLSPVKRGASPRPIADLKYFDDNGEYAWVRISDVSASNRYLENTTQQLSEIGSSLSVKQFPGDLFLSIAGTVGKPIITKIKCCIHDGFVYFPNLKINPEYLYYVFSTGEPYKGLGKWGTQLNLNTETVGYIPISLPPNEYEISRIVKHLDAKTTQIDNLISKKQKLIELLKEERATIINQAVTKGLNPDAPMKDSGVEWIGEVPEKWEVKRLKWLIKGKLKYGANEATELTDESLPRYIRITDFDDDGTLRIETFKSLPYEIAKDYLLHDGDILFARSGATVGKTFLYQNYKGIACYAGYLIKASVNSELILSNFLYYYTKSSTYENWKDSVFIQATIQNIGADKYQMLNVPRPPMNEQVGIVKHIDKETTKIDQTTSKIEKQIDLLKEFRTTLISEAVTGKIDVRDEESNE